MQFTADQFASATGCARGVALTWVRPVSDACEMFEIDTSARLIPFLAAVGTESGGFTRTVENLNYSAEGLLKTWPSRYTPQLAGLQAHHQDEIANHVYGGRMGNKDPGDGFKFRGRGLLQVTGRANYDAVMELLRERIPSTPDLIAMPETLAEPRWAALSAGALWRDWGLNELADADEFLAINRRINMGDKNSRAMPNGWDDRRARYDRAKRVFA